MSNPSQSLLCPKADDDNDDDGHTVNTDYGACHQGTIPEASTALSLSDEQTTIFGEMVMLAKNAAPIVVSYLLQYLCTLTTMSVVGHLGSNELAAAALALTTANITGYAIYEGLTTGLDTLCSQAYGAGRLELVGLHVQRMVCLLLLVTIPIGAAWTWSPRLLALIIPEQDIAWMAGSFLRVLLLGAPGYALFEAERRFLQAQGLFHGPLIVALIGFPTNVLLNWLFVWRFRLGFTGAALALSVTRDLLPILLLIYIVLVKPESLKCWGGCSMSIFSDWGVMLSLSFPGILLVEAEWLAFELQTIAASYLSATDLAAQSVVMAVCIVMAHIPYSIAVGVSTRLGTLIGSRQLHAARIAERAYYIVAVAVGLVNGVFVMLFRGPIIRFFTEDAAVTAIASTTIPVLSVVLVFDSITAVMNGLLRGIGRQSTGAWINFIAYYAIGLPLGLALCFGPLNLTLRGLWTGIIVGSAFITLGEGAYCRWYDWRKAVEGAQKRF